MAITSGFFNSVNGDRRYNAEQFSGLIDTLIKDGVFSHIGTSFSVTAIGGNNVGVGVGLGWFNSTWIRNDGLYPILLNDAEVLLDRIDAIVIEINHASAVRNGSVKLIRGTPSSTPERPDLINTDEIHQRPLAYIYRTAGAVAVSQADITNMVGTSACPYVIGILEVANIDKIVAQWESEFRSWFNGLEIVLEGDVAANLAAEIADIYSKFDTMVSENVLYDTIEDHNGLPIEDSNGQTILSKVPLKVSGDTDTMTKSTYDPEKKEKPYIPYDEALDKMTYDPDGDGVVNESKNTQYITNKSLAMNLSGTTLNITWTDASD